MEYAAFMACSPLLINFGDRPLFSNTILILRPDIRNPLSPGLEAMAGAGFDPIGLLHATAT
jgi:hypothetical protein